MPVTQLCSLLFQPFILNLKHKDFVFYSELVMILKILKFNKMYTALIYSVCGTFTASNSVTGATQVLGWLQRICH